MTRRQRGFTLIEMAIVLVIVGVFVAAGIQVASSVQDGDARAETVAKLDRIQKALQVYVIEHGCLPCPADGTLLSSNANAGQSQTTGGVYSGTGAAGCGGATSTCLSANGIVPWVSLGLNEQDIVDGWKNRVRYGVATSSTWSSTPSGCPVPDRLHRANGMVRCQNAFPAGNVTIRNADDSSVVTTAAAYALVSSGPDRSLAINTAGTETPDVYGQSGAAANTQADNANDDTTFTVGSVSTVSTTAHYDDIVRFENAATLILKCGPAACGNPA